MTISMFSSPPVTPHLPPKSQMFLLPDKQTSGCATEGLCLVEAQQRWSLPGLNSQVIFTVYASESCHLQKHSAALQWWLSSVMDRRGSPENCWSNHLISNRNKTADISAFWETRNELNTTFILEEEDLDTYLGVHLVHRRLDRRRSTDAVCRKGQSRPDCSEDA